MGKNFDSGPVDRNDPGGRGSVTSTGDKTRVIGGANQTQHEDTENIEEEDTDPYTTNGNWDGFGWVVGFCGSHPENLGSQERIGGTDQHRAETSETTRSSWYFMILGERAGIILFNRNRLFT